MVTPIKSNGKIDLAAAERIADNIINNGTSPFVMGTTGELVSIPDEERLSFAEKVVEITNGRTMTYVGISSNCFQNSLHFLKQYFDVGTDVVVAHLPNFYPLIMYNIPITAHHSIPLDVADQLSRHPNIAGLKDSEANMSRFEKAASLWKDREDFSVLMGCSKHSAEGLALGADGIVPSGGNLIPAMFSSLYQAAAKGDSETAIYYQQKADCLCKIYLKDKILSESLPALKIIMNYLGLYEPHMLSPLLEPPETVRQEIIKQVEASGIMK